ncbi:MAG: hypothetical protein CM1200mP18_19510 [Gammaproteobacteria bacterium]|nr:MAG: hypothetical protein CM1200mP18_19510 [Gammaproteobacteria bacterium]
MHFLGKWVRERGDFSLAQAIQRLTSHPADLYGLIDRGRIQPGAHADMMLFDPKGGGYLAKEPTTYRWWPTNHPPARRVHTFL